MEYLEQEKVAVKHNSSYFAKNSRIITVKADICISEHKSFHWLNDMLIDTNIRAIPFSDKYEVMIIKK